MSETNYAEFAKHITLDNERVIKTEVRTEGLTESEMKKVRCAFNEFCEKLKSINHHATSGGAISRRRGRK